jgi:glucose/arabinose dehydrogenase
VAALLPVVAAVAPPASAAGSFPAGFTDTKVAGNLGQATAVAALPDGRYLVTTQSGQLKVVHNATVTTALDLAALSKVCTDAEEGLLGVAVDPNFATNGRVYLYYTSRQGSCALNGASPGGAKNRVSRFTMIGSSIDPSTEVILLDNMPEYGGNHNGGDVHLGNDGTLYVTVGDGGAGRPDSNPADMSMPNGKVLRINLDGSIPAGNPNGTTVCRTAWGPPGTAKTCGEIWADGLRNPFRLGFDAGAPGAKFRIDDVGDATWEEVDAGIAGAHYGWPCREGPAPHASSAPCNTPMTDPLLWYNHSTGCDVMTGGTYVPSGTWQGYDGDYLFVDFGCGDLFLATPGQEGAASTTLATGLDMTTDLEFLPVAGSFALFYTTYANGGQLREVIGPSPTPPPPTIPDNKFTPVAPQRVLDTRTGTGVAQGALTPNSSITVKVTGTPVPANATAVALNLTATGASSPGFVTAWPTGATQPATSSLNLSAPAETAANEVVVAVGSGGRVNLFSQPGGDLIGDVTGYFTAAASTTDGRFDPAPAPTRLLDTRTGVGGKSTPFQPGEQFALTVAGQGGVPVDATAVALTVTYTNVVSSGFLTVWPTGQSQPVTSTSNPNGPSDVRSNLAMVGIGTGGKVSIFSHSGTDVIVDVVGWFTTHTGTHGRFTVVAPARLADSRLPGAPFGRIAPNTEASMNFTSAEPGGEIAVLYNLTATNTSAGGYLTAHPQGTARPVASSVNWSGAGQSRAALTVSSLSGSGVVKIYALTATDALIDVGGWFQS